MYRKRGNIEVPHMRLAVHISINIKGITSILIKKIDYRAKHHIILYRVIKDHRIMRDSCYMYATLGVTVSRCI